MKWQNRHFPIVLDEDHPIECDPQQIPSLFATVTTLVNTVMDLSTTVSELHSTVRKQQETIEELRKKAERDEYVVVEPESSSPSSPKLVESLESRVTRLDSTTKVLLNKARESNSSLGDLRQRLDDSESSTNTRFRDLETAVQNQHRHLETAVGCLRDSKDRIHSTSTALQQSVRELADRSTRLQKSFDAQHDQLDLVKDRLKQYEDGEIANFGLMDAITDMIADATANGIQTLTERAIEATATGVKTLRERAADLSHKQQHWSPPDPKQLGGHCDENENENETSMIEARPLGFWNPVASSLGWMLLLVL